jgi:hypothetical protein
MKLYVPNPQKWVNFFDRVSSGKTTLNQTGAGRRLSVIPVDESKAVDDKKYSIQAVLPAEQTSARAKSELEREDINPASVAHMLQSTSRQRRRGTKRKRTDKKSQTGAKGQRGITKEKTNIKKKTSPKRQKKSDANKEKDIFEIN